MPASTPRFITLYEQHAPRWAWVLLGLLVCLHLLRAAAFAVPAPRVLPEQVVGQLGLGLAYLLIAPVLWSGRHSVVAVSFVHVGLFSLAQWVAPAGAAWLGGFALATQFLVALLVLLKRLRSQLVS